MQMLTSARVFNVLSSYRAWSAERDRADGMPGASAKQQQQQQYGRDGGSGHGSRDGYMNQPPPRQWDNRAGGYRPFMPGQMGLVLVVVCVLTHVTSS